MHIGVNYPPDFSYDATRNNAESFARRYVMAFGGSLENALSVWSVAVFSNESRDLSRPFDPVEVRNATARAIYKLIH